MCSISLARQALVNDSDSISLSVVKPAKRNSIVHVWVVPFSVLHANKSRSNHLSVDEQVRASTMLTPLGAQQYRLARTFLRSVLTMRMNCRHADVGIQYTDSGKPYVPDGPAFNLSHCRNLLVVAVAEPDFNGQIGVDVEPRVTNSDCLRLADKCFTLSERQELVMFQPGKSRRNAFTRGWTRKEAMVKAIGTGLAAPLESFEISLQPCSICESGRLKSDRRSMLLASQLSGISPENSQIYDLGCNFDCEMSLAIVNNGTGCITGGITNSISEVQVHEVNEHHLSQLVGFGRG